MAEVWIVNASPLIVLARAGCLHLLEALAPMVIVPGAVAREIAAGPVEDPARVWIEKDGIPCISADLSVPARIAALNLGAGESAVLAHAQHHPGSEAILDDLAARRAAAALSIPTRGTLSIILTAKQRGLIPAAAPYFARVERAGLFVSASLRSQALALVGE